MTQVFAWTGFITLVLVLLALGAWLLTYLAWLVINRTTSWMETLRIIWSFYQSLPRPLTRTPYYVALYDRTTCRFIASKGADEREANEMKARWTEE